jgi:hypothetical protein
MLFCWDNGKPPRPDTITRRFERLARAAGLPEIDLHDLRQNYATSCNTKIDWTALSRRIGHADVAFAIQQYVQTGLEVANTLADLIIGGLLANGIDGQDDEHDGGAVWSVLANCMQEAVSLFERRPLSLVAGAGFEPATSGL